MGWFKRLKEGITTSTREKKKRLKVFGTNARLVRKFIRFKITPLTNMCALNANTMSELVAENISKYCSITTSSPNSMKI